jgi:hypothetical protein
MSYYAWPASALTHDDLAALYRIRESSRPKIPINVLISLAVRDWCARQVIHPTATASIQKEAA